MMSEASVGIADDSGQLRGSSSSMCGPDCDQEPDHEGPHDNGSETFRAIDGTVESSKESKR